jgi:glycolate oxidase FAD binding subunit
MLIEWGGAQRWLRGDADGARMRDVAARRAATRRCSAAAMGNSGPAACSRRCRRLMEVHRRLKQSFDPYGVFNPGRLYPEL